MAKELDIQGIYELVGEKIRGIFNAQVIDIVTYDKRTQLIEDRYDYEKGDRTLLGPRPLKGFRKHVFDTGKTWSSMKILIGKGQTMIKLLLLERVQNQLYWFLLSPAVK